MVRGGGTAGNKEMSDVSKPESLTNPTSSQSNVHDMATLVAVTAPVVSQMVEVPKHFDPRTDGP